jgi:glycine/D-amino acid oxidase-like deaminating enzyme
MDQNFDFLVVGGGIAGVAVGSELARHGSVLLIERESTLGIPHHRAFSSNLNGKLRQRTNPPAHLRFAQFL